MAANIEENPEDVIFPEVMEAPRYSCALAGAYSTAIGIYGVVPILHSGLGCGIGQLFGQFYAGGQNAGGPQGGTSTPCSGLVEEHVIFGGEDKLRRLIKSSIELMQGDLYAVLSGCVPSLTGDDIESVVKEFRDEAPIIYVKSAGFLGNSYEGYELFFEALIDQLLTKQPVRKGLVNIFGVVPYQHIWWKGNLKAIKEDLQKLGLDVNIIFTQFDGLESLIKIPAAELNIVLSPWNGQRVAKRLQEKFGTPFITLPGVPVGPKQTTRLLKDVGRALQIPRKSVEELIAREERSSYRFQEYLGDVMILAFPQPYFAVVADSGTAVGITQFLTNEVGYLPDKVIIADGAPEESREAIVQELTENMECIAKPEVIFEEDSHLIRENLKSGNSLVLLASSLENPIASELGAVIHVTVSFPSFDRLILDHNYAGYRGGLTLMEDIVSKYCGPL
jgi:nitrogenase molybdenum-iron protein beta chain